MVALFSMMRAILLEFGFSDFMTPLTVRRQGSWF